MNTNLTRRDFSKSALMLLAGAMSPWPPDVSALEKSSQPALRGQGVMPHYRAVSWWLTWQDLTWPNAELQDRIRRRADQCAASAVNCCLIFGAHFRWDFMPLWGRLHEELRFIADELHQRNILLFDHHSSVLVHRPRNRKEAEAIWNNNRHHVPFYPAADEAARWEYNGVKLNDWRMLDVETGQPVYLPAYNAEQFCMNHPAFRAAYGQYIQQCLQDTGVDGLMSDDGIFYGGWRACACPHCRERFQREYGHRLPPVSDHTFWGNRKNAAFRDWITLRFRSSGDFLQSVRKILPANFPLLTCCASSDGSSAPAHGMSYEDFAESCSHVLLEMVGSTPSLAGTWNERIPSQLLHLGIARAHRLPCLGLGYGFFPDTAFFIWAVNKFLGADAWISTLKGRLADAPDDLATLADDAELAGEAFRWEKLNSHLFQGAVDTGIALFFSRSTRDYYAQLPADYASDYAATCLGLSQAGITSEVVTRIPDFGRIQCLLVSSAVCLSAEERQRLSAFAKAGGTIIATGPVGFFDERGERSPTPWLADLGGAVTLEEPLRPGGFPPDENITDRKTTAFCRMTKELTQSLNGGWWEKNLGAGRFFWHAERMTQKAVVESVVARLNRRANLEVKMAGFPKVWRQRQYRDGHRLLIHALPEKVEAVPHARLQKNLPRQAVVEKIIYQSLVGELTLRSATDLQAVTLHSPDLPSAREGRLVAGQWRVSLSSVRRYFILECLLR